MLTSARASAGGFVEAGSERWVVGDVWIWGKYRWKEGLGIFPPTAAFSEKRKGLLKRNGLLGFLRKKQEKKLQSLRGQNENTRKYKSGTCKPEKLSGRGSWGIWPRTCSHFTKMPLSASRRHLTKRPSHLPPGRTETNESRVRTDRKSPYTCLVFFQSCLDGVDFYVPPWDIVQSNCTHY